MTLAVLLFLAGALGGALNSVAGGGSFIVFPAMLFAGIPPVSANATTTAGLWPASLSSAFAYRRELPRERRVVLLLALASLAGGGAGAFLLLRTSEATFAKMIPILIGFAAALFTFGGRVQRRMTKRLLGHGPASPRALALGAVAQLAIATYGGYFGGGMGILMLATFAVMGLTNIHAMNGLKNVLGASLNGVALVAFVATGHVRLGPAAAAAAGAVLGGYGGASLARRIAPARVRVGVVAFAWAMTAYFAYRAWLA